MTMQGEGFGQDSGYQFNAQAARAELDELLPREYSEPVKAYNDAMSAIVRGVATPEQAQLVIRVEQLQSGHGRLQDYFPVESTA